MMREQRMSPSGSEVEATLLRTIRELLAEVRPAGVTPAVRLDSQLDSDLGLDSLAVAELLVRTEEVFDVALADEVLASVETARDLFTELTAAAEGSGPPDRPVSQVFRPASTSLPVRNRGAGRRMAEVMYALAATATFAVVAAGTWLLVVLLPGGRRRWEVVGRAGDLLFRLVGVPVCVEGAEHLPVGRPYVVAANHASHLDPLLLTVALPDPAVFLAVRDLAANPFTRLFLRRMGAHLVERGDRVRGVEASRVLTDTVRSGRLVAVFPEGRRSPAPGLEPFHMGAFVIASGAGVPVVPVALRGTRRILPVGRILPRRGSITVTVAPPVETAEAGWAGAVELHAATRAAILRHCGEPATG